MARKAAAVKKSGRKGTGEEIPFVIFADDEGGMVVRFEKNPAGTSVFDPPTRITEFRRVAIHLADWSITPIIGYCDDPNADPRRIRFPEK